MTNPNRPFNFDPVDALPFADGELHTSARTAITTSADAHGQRVTTINATHLRMTSEGGVLRMRFGQTRHTAPARPVGARVRRPGLRQ